MFNPSSGLHEQTFPLLCPTRTVHSALVPSQTPLAAHALSARPFMHFVPFANTGFGGHLSDTPAHQKHLQHKSINKTLMLEQALQGWST
jgi:hypothetical protein